VPGHLYSDLGGFRAAAGDIDMVNIAREDLSQLGAVINIYLGSGVGCPCREVG